MAESMDQKFQAIIDQSFRAISTAEVEQRKRVVGLDADDLVRIEALRDLVNRHIDEYSNVFFDYLSNVDGADGLFKDPALLAEGRSLNREQLITMVGGVYDQAYIEQRMKIAALYNRAQLNARVFLGAYHHLLRSLGTTVMASFADADGGFAHFLSLKKIVFFDLGIIMDSLVADRERTINMQQAAIRELSTPALQVRDRLFILPIIGLLDSMRAKQLTEGLLGCIRVNRAKVVVMDVTGVGTIDSNVANHLIQTVVAARLMGAKVIISGLSADVAQALVGLGIDLSGLDTVGDLQGGIEQAERLLGYTVATLTGSVTHAAAS
jgi:rsbT co-antagonist protein RsbR